MTWRKLEADGVRSISSGRQPVRQRPKDLTEIDFFLCSLPWPNIRSQHSRPDSNAMEMPSLLSQKVEVLEAPRLRTRAELSVNEEAVRFSWASWAIHGFFKKLTDCGDAS